ncbi:MAG: hypothetical protein P1P76_08500 [Anaerolineales bacterium]|nr:hypothetical protein [Anaerolineales bacterium]
MNDQNWKNRIYLLGVVLGALTGLGVAVVLVKRAEETGEELKFGTREGLRLGVGVLGLLRQVSRLGVPED